jgi:hypothetical protein
MIDTIQRLKNVAEFIGNTTGRENARWIYDVADELERLRSELQQAKDQVIEECAKVAETAGCGDRWCKGCVGNQVAAAIRSLSVASTERP